MKKLIKPLFVLLVVTFVSLLGGGIFVTKSTRSKVTALRQEIEQKGDPLFLVDFQTEPIEDEVNGYVYLMNTKEDIDSFEEFLTVNINAGSIANFEDPKNLSKSEIETLAKGIDDHRQLFIQLERMAEFQQFRADLDLKKGIGMLTPQYPMCSRIGLALEAKTILDVSQQKGDVALENCIQGLRIARMLMDQTTVMVFSAALGMEYTMIDSAYYVVATTPTSDETRTELARELANSNRRSSLLNSLKMERACGIQTFKDLRESNNTNFGGTNALKQIPGFGLKQAYLNDDETEYIRWMNYAIENPEKTHAERVEFGKQFTRKLDRSDFRFSITKLLGFSWIPLAEAVDHCSAKADCLKVILRLQAEGETALDDLPQDPYTNQPLVTKESSQGWKIYSVGKNLQDDQGDFTKQAFDFSSPPDIGYGPFQAVSADQDEN